MSWRERLSEARGFVEDRTGVTVTSRDRLDLLEASDVERRATQKELDLLAYTALDYVSGRPQEMKATERRKLIQKARVAWMKDPQAGAAVDLMNDFVFGRGIPKPKAADGEVQKVLDEAFDDADNQLVLTSYQAQLAMGTDLSLQSNFFLLVFDDGEDGKVKLGILEHDTVEQVVRDPENRLRILYYVAKHFRQEWDFERDQPKVDLVPEGREGRGEVQYFAHWRNVEDATQDAKDGVRDKPTLAPEGKTGSGKVFHVALNRTTEMAFGHPTMDRTLRWFSAYNAFMDARLDIIQAKAAFIMKRKVKGTKGQVEKLATQALSRRSALGAAAGEGPGDVGPRAGSILTENEEVSHEDFSLDTGAGAAQQDSQMIRAQVSAAERWPQSYLGDATSANLATATSLELPVLKHVEARQELIESAVRFFLDRVIERAVETDRIAKELTPEEAAALGKAAPSQATTTTGDEPPSELQAAHEDKREDEEATQRDLSYEFSMPSPLKRMMGDLVGAVQNIARTFDPNNTNVELSRVLLGVALGEGLELEDPQRAVEKIFPAGYMDPAQAAAAAPPAGGEEEGEGFGEFTPISGPPGADGRRNPDPANPYGAPMRARPPEVAMQQAWVKLEELRHDQLPEDVQAFSGRRREQVEQAFEQEVMSLLPGADKPSNGRS